MSGMDIGSNPNPSCHLHQRIGATRSICRRTALISLADASEDHSGILTRVSPPDFVLTTLTFTLSLSYSAVKTQ
jgi:hypothetical protein